MSGAPPSGRVEEILVYPERRAPARECEEAIAVSGVGWREITAATHPGP